MLSYNNYVTDKDGNTYSTDMVRVSLAADKASYQHIFDTVFQNEDYKKVTYKQSFKELQYHHFFAIDYYGSGVVKMGVSLNGTTRDQARGGYIEFNPNRFSNCEAFWEDYGRILDCIPDACLSRFDLAIDIPCPRDKLMLVKDGREYACFSKSSVDITEYLGQRNQPGRVKLYNKQLESALDYPLSRLEITGTEDKLNIPVVLDLRRLPPGKDGVLIRTLADNPYRSLTLAALSPYMRRNVIKYMSNNQITFDSKCIKDMLDYAVRIGSGRRTLKIRKEINKPCINILTHQLTLDAMLSEQK